uniref:Uncharacterized protein n=1 Tax=Siphoviridae sp. ctxjx4 TaxID=2826522 RepID=A0A8S5M2I0_9CAUD|nr:MAG TPA: hypothetical protein [Siphoviridae sp. ctxjx4]
MGVISGNIYFSKSENKNRCQQKTTNLKIFLILF